MTQEIQTKIKRKRTVCDTKSGKRKSFPLSLLKGTSFSLFLNTVVNKFNLSNLPVVSGSTAPLSQAKAQDVRSNDFYYVGEFYG